MTHSPPLRTFAEACESVLRNPDGEHSLYTTLAPLYDRMMADADDHYTQQLRALVENTAGTPETALEIGCGVGGLLPHLEAQFPHVVGLDVHPALLAFAERRARHAVLVEGDITDCDLDRRFDVAAAFEYVVSHFTADADLTACFETVHDHLESDGVFVFDAVVDPVAVTEDAVGVFVGSGYRLERAVDVVPAPAVSGVECRTDYRVTDIAGDRQETASERMAVRTFEAEELQKALATVGFERVDVDDDGADDGAVVVAARR